MQGLDEEEKMEATAVNDTKMVVISEKKRRAPFAYWTVGGVDHKLKLTTQVICQIEEKYKQNLLNLLFTSGSIPPLAVMLTIIQGAMKTWEHGVQYKAVQDMFDQYCEEGGTQMSLLTDVVMPVYNVSGFFSESQRTAMDEKLEEVKDNM